MVFAEVPHCSHGWFKEYYSEAVGLRVIARSESAVNGYTQAVRAALNGSASSVIFWKTPVRHPSVAKHSDLSANSPNPFC